MVWDRGLVQYPVGIGTKLVHVRFRYMTVYDGLPKPVSDKNQVKGLSTTRSI